MSVKPFKIEVSTQRLERLKQKLALADYPPDDTGVADGWQMGTPASEIERLGRYWQTQFDWEGTVSRLNKLPHHTIQVDVGGFGRHDIHFIHKKSERRNAVPLLFLHGWPGCFLEVVKLLPALVDSGSAEEPAFDVVAPSLINFGFSSRNSQKDFNVDQHAEAYHKLMLELGYNEYVIQSGDIGHLIARFIAEKYGRTHCKAYHTNSPFPDAPKADSHPELYAKAQSIPLSEAELACLQRAQAFSTAGMGYYKQLSTKPRTIGLSLRDSPIGLLAWLYEKLHDWADEYPWTDDEIITWVSIYYFSRAGPEASGLIYYASEHRDPPAFPAAQAYIDVPLGITRFTNDLVLLPKIWNHTLGPIVFENEYEGGGHFAAWERPDAIVNDLRRMFGRGGAAFGCVAGRNGYGNSI